VLIYIFTSLPSIYLLNTLFHIAFLFLSFQAFTTSSQKLKKCRMNVPWSAAHLRVIMTIKTGPSAFWICIFVFINYIFSNTYFVFTVISGFEFRFQKKIPCFLDITCCAKPQLDDKDLESLLRKSLLAFLALVLAISNLPPQPNQNSISTTCLPHTSFKNQLQNLSLPLKLCTCFQRPENGPAHPTLRYISPSD